MRIFERCEKYGVNAELILMAGILIGAIATFGFREYYAILGGALIVLASMYIYVKILDIDITEVDKK